jgi:argininosuccinate lyase
LRDVDRLLATRQRLNVSPLGAGALAGSSLPLDPQFTASLLAFDEAFINSLDAVSDRDFVAETLFDLALIGVHLSRMGEELVLWTSAEFNFATLSDAFTTGSSMLPQKKNSDVAELSRGKSARVIGDLVTLLTLLKGLPLSYNRDLQEDKEPLFDAVRTSLLVLEALRGTYDTMQFNVDVASAAANDELLGAIDIAEELVREGVPFRHAHEAAGRAVRESIANGQALGEYVANDPELSRFAGIFTDGPLVARRTSPGSSGATAAPAQKSAISLKIKQFRAAI